jgi:hypothetical protein
MTTKWKAMNHSRVGWSILWPPILWERSYLVIASTIFKISVKPPGWTEMTFVEQIRVWAENSS